VNFLWKIFLKDTTTEIEPVSLHDAIEIIGKYIILKSSFFNDLYERVKTKRHYFSEFKIDKVLGPDEKDWSDNSWYLIMGSDKEKLKLWILVKQEPDATGRIVGYGPDNFVEYIKSKREYSVEEHIISIIKDPKKWVNLIILVN
jgi:hypothetical protein